MISTSSFFHSTEFFVILFVVAAAVVIAVAIPKQHGPVKEFTLGCDLFPDSGQAQAPSVELICRDDRSVALVRHGLQGVTMGGGVGLDVEVKGFHITVREVLSEGNEWGSPASDAMALMHFVAAERYTLRYESAALSLSANLTFRNTPGYRCQAALVQ